MNTRNTHIPEPSRENARWPASPRERRRLGILALVVGVPVAVGAVALGYPPLLGAAIAALGVPHLRATLSLDPTAGP